MTASFPFSRPTRRAATLLGAVGLVAMAATSASGEEAYQPVFGPAIDWSVLVSLTESFELTNNRQLNGNSNGVEAQGVLGVGVSVEGVGKRTRFGLSTGFNLGRSTDDDISNLNRLDPNISASAVFLGKGFSINASLTGRTRATSASELEDTGFTNVNATRIDVSSSLGISWQATKRDSLSVSASAQFVDFSRSVGVFTPSQTFGVSGSWSRQATATTTYSFSTSFRHFEAGGANSSTSKTANVQLGIQHSRTSRHSLGGSAGFSFVSSDRADGTSSTQIGFVGGATFGYTIDEFNASLALNQSIRPSADGDLNAFTSLTGSLAYRINSLQSLRFGITYSRRSDISGGGDVLQFVSLGPSYSYSLSENASLSLGYQFRVRDDVTNSFQTGHQVTLSLSQGLTLLQ